jgi:hypothetical protein
MANKNTPVTPEPVTIDVTGMDPAMLAALQNAMAKDGGKSLLTSLTNAEKYAATTRIADHAYRATTKFLKEKFCPEVYAKAYEWEKAVAADLESKGLLKKDKAVKA